MDAVIAAERGWMRVSVLLPVLLAEARGNLGVLVSG